MSVVSGVHSGWAQIASCLPFRKTRSPFNDLFPAILSAGVVSAKCVMKGDRFPLVAISRAHTNQ